MYNTLLNTKLKAGKPSAAGILSGHVISDAASGVKALRLEYGARAKQASPSWDVSMSPSEPLEPQDFVFSARSAPPLTRLVVVAYDQQDHP